jgi:hypothetical protein
LVFEGLAQLAPKARDSVLKIAGARRSMVPGLDLTFINRPPRYDHYEDIMIFPGQALGKPVQCGIRRNALDDHFRSHNQQERLETFLRNRSIIESMARIKYLTWPVEELESVLIDTLDVQKLRGQSSSQAPASDSTHAG